MRVLHPHINSYHRDDQLLFQFLLSEFFQIPQQITILEDFKAIGKKKLASTLEVLAGPAHDYLRPIGWHSNTGLLQKMISYCSRLSEEGNPETQKMQRLLNKAWIYCLEAQDASKQWAAGANSRELSALIAEVQKQLDRSAAILPKMISEYQNNENVLFFILRHKDQFDNLLGKGTTLRVLKKLFPSGLDTTRQFLARRYKKRGFEALVPVIAAKIEELE